MWSKIFWIANLFLLYMKSKATYSKCKIGSIHKWTLYQCKWCTGKCTKDVAHFGSHKSDRSALIVAQGVKRSARITMRWATPTQCPIACLHPLFNQASFRSIKNCWYLGVVHRVERAWLIVAIYTKVASFALQKWARKKIVTWQVFGAMHVPAAEQTLASSLLIPKHVVIWQYVFM